MGEVAQEASWDSETADVMGQVLLLLVHVWAMAVLPALLDSHRIVYMSGGKDWGAETRTKPVVC